MRHSVAEEAYLYPATRRVVPGGDKLADEELAEHPSAPDIPPLNKLAAPGAGLADRIRDAFSGHGKL